MPYCDDEVSFNGGSSGLSRVVRDPQNMLSSSDLNPSLLATTEQLRNVNTAKYEALQNGVTCAVPQRPFIQWTTSKEDQAGRYSNSICHARCHSEPGTYIQEERWLRFPAETSLGGLEKQRMIQLSGMYIVSNVALGFRSRIYRWTPGSG